MPTEPHHNGRHEKSRFALEVCPSRFAHRSLPSRSASRRFFPSEVCPSRFAPRNFSHRKSASRRSAHRVCPSSLPLRSPLGFAFPHFFTKSHKLCFWSTLFNLLHSSPSPTKRILRDATASTQKFSSTSRPSLTHCAMTYIAQAPCGTRSSPFRGPPSSSLSSCPRSSYPSSSIFSITV